MRLLRSKAAHAVLAALLLGVFLMQLALSIRHQSQTYDEGFHLVAGYRYWQCGDFGINSEHPPLMKWVAAAPLWFGHDPALGRRLRQGADHQGPRLRSRCRISLRAGAERRCAALSRPDGRIVVCTRARRRVLPVCAGVVRTGGGIDRAPAAGIRAHDPRARRLDHNRHCGDGVHPGLGLRAVSLLPKADCGTLAAGRHSHRAYLCLQAFRRVDRAHPDRAEHRRVQALSP